MRALIKIFCGVLVLAFVVHALPADRPTIEKLDRVDLEQDSGSESEEFPIGPSLIPLDGFLSGFNDMFERLRQQMIHLMSQVPLVGGPPQGGNTTSVTKIIDGHKVIINETVYASPDGEDAGAVFKVRVVDIRPDSFEDTSDDVDKQPVESVESMGESQENEIPKTLRTSHTQKRKINTKDFFNTNAIHEFKEIEAFDYPINNNNNNNLETFDELDSTGLESFDSFGDNIPTESKPNLETFDEEPLGNSIESFDDEDKAIVYKNKNKNHHEIDLSNDIKINQIAEMQGRPHNPNAEVVDFQPARPFDLSRDTYINEIAEQQGFPRNPDAEAIDVEEFSGGPLERIIPFGDLSRDTYVNEIAARRRVPLNSDAEFLDMDPRHSRYFYRTHHHDS